MTHRLSTRLQLDYSNVLVAIFELSLRSGIRAENLLRVCVQSLKRAEIKSRLNRNREYGVRFAAALVLDAWHRDRRYLNSRGTPKPLRLLGPAPSVEALVRRQKVPEHASEVARHLKAVQLVVRCRNNLYKPTSDVALISARDPRDPLVLQYASRALLTLLETVGQNVSGAGHLSPLIERVAEVPDLPRKEIEAFKTFTQLQGRTFVRTINDWLVARRGRRSSWRRTNGTVRAGIHTYAYIAPKRRRQRLIEIH
jgi:Family of unknown function (DUF6502)